MATGFLLLDTQCNMLYSNVQYTKERTPMQNRILDGIQIFHDVSAGAMVKIAPIIAPAPSAIALYMALYEPFGVVGAGVLALVVECLGFAVVHLLMRTIVEDAGKTLIGFSIAFSAVYLGTVFGIIALLPHNEAWAKVARAFPLLTFVGAGIVGTNFGLDHRQNATYIEAKKEIDLDHYKARLRIERKQLAAVAQPQAAIPTGNKSNKELIEQYLAKHPEATRTEVIVRTGVTRATGNRMLKQMGR